MSIILECYYSALFVCPLSSSPPVVTATTKDFLSTLCTSIKCSGIGIHKHSI